MTDYFNRPYALEEWAARRKTYLDGKPDSLDAIEKFSVFWDTHVRRSDVPTMVIQEWNSEFLDFLLHFYLAGNPNAIPPNRG